MEKKQLFTILLAGLLHIFPVSAQTFKTAFVHYDNVFNNGDGYSNSDNLEANLAWGESYILAGYMAMYRATEDVYFLRKLVTHAKSVINHRDDHLGYTDYQGISGATWLTPQYTNGTPYAWVVHSGMITYPMADFVQLVVQMPALHNQLSNEGLTLINEANFLLTEIGKTIAAHDSDWDSVTDVYRFENVGFLNNPGAVLPHNMYAAMGRTLLMMYRATNNSAYLQKTIGLANYLKNGLTYNPTTDSYFWSYYLTGSSEDISHGAIEVDFATLCYEDGIVFDATDMERFAHTLINNIYQQPLSFADRVDGSGNSNTYIAQIGRWLELAAIDGNIYHPLADVYIDNGLCMGCPAISPSRLLALANCALYQPGLNPIATYRGSGSASQWAGIAVGDFNADGMEELVTVRNFDGQFYIYGVAQGTFTSIANTTSIGNASAWAGVAAGDFDGDGRDEFVGVRNFDGEFYMYELDNGQITLKAKTTTIGNSSQWAGIAAGDFDGDGRDEFVGVRNFDGEFYMYEMVNGQIKLKANTTTIGNSSQWAGVAAGDFDDDGRDEFVGVRNSDGQFYMYELVSGQIVVKASTTSIGSASDWIDITAGNFDLSPADEFAAVRNFDGDMFFYRYDISSGAIEVFEREYFPADFSNAPLGAGAVGSLTGNLDNLIILRGFDADFFVYGPDFNNGTSVHSEEPPATKTGGRLVHSVYPNPAGEYVQIRIDNYVGQTISCNLLNIWGITVRTVPRLEILEPTSTVRIEIGYLPKGFYYLQIEDGKHRETLKLLKL